MILTSVWILRITGIFFGLISWMTFCSEEIIDYSFEKSLRIEKIFQLAAEKAENFKRTHGHYPNSTEFENWRDELTQFGLYGEIIDYQTKGFRDEVLTDFGQPKGDVFVLHIWRGEWSEYYASWSSQSSLPKSRSDYYETGNRYFDTAILLFLGVFLFVSAVLLKKLRYTTRLGNWG